MSPEVAQAPGSDASDPRIIAIGLDERTILRRNENVERERRVAVFDLLERNYFRPQTEYEGGYAGPYRIFMRIEEDRLAIDIATKDDVHLETLTVSVLPLRRTIRSYFGICDSYYDAVRRGASSTIETVDMARRGIHNEAAEMLQERLAERVELDFDTARRLFTLLCVLHIKV